MKFDPVGIPKSKFPQTGETLECTPETDANLAQQFVDAGEWGTVFQTYVIQPASGPTWIQDKRCGEYPSGGGVSWFTDDTKFQANGGNAALNGWTDQEVRDWCWEQCTVLYAAELTPFAVMAYSNGKR